MKLLKSTWQLFVFACAFIAIMLGTYSVSSSEVRVEPTPNLFAIEQGARSFNHYCAPCHGESGHGDGRFFASSLEPAPPDFTSPEFRSTYTDGRLRDAIGRGSAALGKSDLCPAWGTTFSNNTVNYLIAYIRQLQQRKESS